MRKSAKVADPTASATSTLKSQQTWTIPGTQTLEESGGEIVILANIQGKQDLGGFDFVPDPNASKSSLVEISPDVHFRISFDLPSKKVKIAKFLDHNPDNSQGHDEYDLEKWRQGTDDMWRIQLVLGFNKETARYWAAAVSPTGMLDKAEIALAPGPTRGVRYWGGSLPESSGSIVSIGFNTWENRVVKGAPALENRTGEDDSDSDSELEGPGPETSTFSQIREGILWWFFPIIMVLTATTVLARYI